MEDNPHQLGVWDILESIEHKYNVLHFVHPIKQREVEKLVDYIIKEKLNIGVVLFGSSTTHRCNFDSDLDLLVWGVDCKKFHPTGVGPVDIIYGKLLDNDSPLWDNIAEEGVYVYRRGKAM